MRLLSLALLLFSLPVAAQDRDPAVAIEKLRAYLERQPFHETAFDRLVAASVSINGLGDLVAQYEEAAAREDAGRSSRVLLARLYAASDRMDDALAALQRIEGDEPELALLRGTVALEARRPEEASAALDLAARSTDDPRLLERIHLARGRARLALGDQAGAVAAFRDLARIDPEDYHLRIAAADALAREGLAAEAVEEYRRAAELAGDDASRRCRALAAGGRLSESLGRVEECLATYAEAIELLARGHWLRTELFERVLAVHRREGTLEELAAETRALVAENPSDLDRRELLAHALEELRALEGARAVLDDAVRDFPADLELGRHRVDVLATLGALDEEIAEYQRLIEEHPDELDLYLELGDLLAKEGRVEQARRQWQRTQEMRLGDPGFCVRLANLYALNGLDEDAIRTLEHAVELEPGELRHFGELANVYVRSGRRDELAGLLDRAETVAGEDPTRLEVFAGLARGLNRDERARSALEHALAIAPDSARLLQAHAEVALEMHDHEAAARSLRAIVARGTDDGERRRAANRLVRLHQRQASLELLARAEEGRAGEDPTAHYVLARIFSTRHETRRALEELEAFVAARPDDELAREDLATLYEDVGRAEDAIAQYDALIEARPATRAVRLQEIARIHAANDEVDAATASYEEILALSPDNPATFVQAASFFTKIGNLERAAECLRQALRLRPEDGRNRLALAKVLREAGDEETANELALQATRDESPEVRDSAREWIHDELVLEGRLQDELARLSRQVAETPYDREAVDSLVDLLVREYEYELALEHIDDVIAYSPGDAALLEKRAELLEEMERYEEALEVYGELARLPDVDREALIYSRAACALALGRKELADEILLESADAEHVARTYSRFGHHEDAVATLERALVLAPTDRRLLQRLVGVHEERGELEEAIAVQRRLLELDGDEWEPLTRALDLALEAEDQARVRDVAARMLATLATPVEPEIEDRTARRRSLNNMRREYRERLNRLETAVRGGQRMGTRVVIGTGTGRAYRVGEDPGARTHITMLVELYRARLEAAPADEDLLNRLLALYEEMEIGARDSIALLDEVRAATLDAGVLPPGRGESSWKRMLDRRVERLLRSDDELAHERAREIAATPEEELTREALDQRIELLQAQGTRSELTRALEQGVEVFPDELEYRAGLAIVLFDRREDERAETELRALIRALEAKGGRHTRRPDDPSAEARFVGRAARKLAPDLQALATDERLATLYRVSEANPVHDAWPVGRVPDLLDARYLLARVLGRLERTDEARAELLAIEPEDPGFAEWAAFLAGAHEALGLDDEAERLRDAVYEVVERAMADPLVRRETTWRTGVRAIVRARITELADAGEVARAYELTRRWKGPEAARAFAVRHADVDLVGTFRARWEEARAGDDPVAIRDAGVLYGELLVPAESTRSAARPDRLAEAVEVFRVLYANEPQDGSLLESLARAEELAGRPAAGIALHLAKMAQRREHYEETGEDLPLRWRPMPPRFNADQILADPAELLPSLPALGADEKNGMISSLTQSLPYMAVPGARKGPNLAYHHVEILRIAYVSEDWKRVATEIRDLQKEAPQLVQFVGYSLRNVLERRDLGADALDLYEVVYEGAGNDATIVLGYGEQLVEAGRAEEARRVYRKYLRANLGSEDYWTKRIEGELAELDASVSITDEGALPADLEAAVGADPSNARLRIGLVRELLARRRFEEALEHAHEAERIAPHIEETHRLLDAALATTGDLDALAERYRERLGREQERGRRLELAAWLADDAWLRGDREAPAELFALAERGARSVDRSLSPAGWWLARGDVAHGRARLERDRGKLDPDSWYRGSIDLVLARLALLDGDPRPLLDAAWSQAGRLGADLADPTLFDQLVDLFLRCDPDTWPAAEALAEQQDGVRSALTRAALALARGRPADDVLVEAALAEPDARPLLLLAVRLARRRGDAEAALAHLARVEEGHAPDPRREVSTPIGQVGERAAFLAEKGQILAEGGDVGAALSTWNEAFGPDREGRRRTARLALAAGLVDEARETWPPGSGRPSLEEAILEAGLAHARGNAEAEVAALDLALEYEAVELGRGRSGAGEVDFAKLRSWRLAAMRALGRHAELRRELLAALAVDPSDPWAAAALVDVTWESGGAAATFELLDRESVDPGEHPELATWLAERAWDAGDLERALDLYWLRVTEENSARTVLEPLVALHFQLGILDELPRTVGICRRAGRADELRWAAYYALRTEGGDPARAAAWMDEAQALDPLTDASGPEGSWGLHADCLFSAGRTDDGMRLLTAALARPETVLADLSERLLESLAKQPEATRAVAAGRGSADAADLGPVLVDACRAWARRDDERALAAVEAALAANPESEIANDLEWRLLERLGRHAEARSAVERRLEHLDALRLLPEPDGRLDGRISEVRDARFRLVLRLEGGAAAIAAARGPLGRRFAVDDDSFELSNLAYGAESWELDRLFTVHRLWEEALAPGVPFPGEALELEARFRVGDRDAVLDKLLRRLSVGGHRPDVRTMLGYGGYVEADEPAYLARFAVEAGREDEVAERLDELRDASGDIRAIEAARSTLQRIITGRPEVPLSLAGVLESERPSEEDLRAFAAAASDAGRYEEARRALERVRATWPGPFHDRNLDVSPYDVEPLHFRPALATDAVSFLTFSSGATRTNWNLRPARGNPLDRIEVLFRSGHVDEAREAQAAELERLSNHGDAAAELTLADRYLARGLLDDALWLYDRWLEEAGDTERAGREVSIHERVAIAAWRLGRTDVRDGRLARYLERSAPASDAEDTAAGRWERARVLASAGGEPAAIRAELERAAALDPAGARTPAPGVAGWIRLALGETDAAVELFRRALEENRIAGTPDPDPRFGLGLALHAAGRAGEAEPELRRALANAPDSPHAQAARRRLGWR